MDEFNLQTKSAYGTVKVCVIRKEIKNVHLRVYRDLSVKLSVPFAVKDEWVENFLESRKDWIVGKLEVYRSTDGHNNLPELRSGSSTQMLGKDMRIIKVKADKNAVEQDEKKIFVYLKDDKDETSLSRSFGAWWREQAAEIFIEQADSLYNSVFRKYGIQKPEIVIKKMKTLWGSCTKSRNKITLNEYLLKADILCIQYVILHEMTHLLYPNHGASFYNFLTVHMPDWKERKKQLDMEVVQGL